MFVRRSELDSLRDAVDDLNDQLGEPERWLESVVSKRLVLHTLKNDITIDGTLMAVMGDGIILRAARIINEGAPPTSLAGEVWIPRDNVAFVQLDE